MISYTDYEHSGASTTAQGPTDLRLDEYLGREVSKMYGAVTTPKEVVDFMLGASGVDDWAGLRVLEPGCGFCDFLVRIHEQQPAAALFGVEMNPQVYELVAEHRPSCTVEFADFLLWNTDTPYDIVIGNPPYGIIGHQSHYPIHVVRDKKLSYRRVISTWHGKYNIYGAFIERGLKLLNDRGKLIFIVPATFMVLDDFKLLRRFMSLTGRVKVFYLGPRIFKGRTVSTAVLVVEKGLSGLELYDAEGLRTPLLCYAKNAYGGEMIRFDSDYTRRFESETSPLCNFFSFRFAARSPEIKKHPEVSREQRDGLVPILTGRNLHPGRIDYDRCYSGLWMARESAPSLRDYYAYPHIVVGHTKGGKLVAAVDSRCYPWREDIHLVSRVSGLDLHAITDYLNSEGMQEYMRSLYRSITPHVTITQLKEVPLTADLQSLSGLATNQASLCEAPTARHAPSCSPSLCDRVPPMLPPLANPPSAEPV